MKIARLKLSPVERKTFNIIAIFAATVLPGGSVLMLIVNRSFGEVEFEKSMSLTLSVLMGTVTGWSTIIVCPMPFAGNQSKAASMFVRGLPRHLRV